MQKRTEITIETERVVVVSRRRKRPVLWCDRCAMEVPMLTVRETPAVERLANAGRLHFAVTPEGRLVICSRSLASAGELPNALSESSTLTRHFDL